MKIRRLGPAKIILSNPQSKHNYFAWPSVVRLQNGRIAVAASGFRLAHICPFGKAVIAFSEDDGETYSFPAPVIDTVLDDRDAGLCPFGESGLILTSFNNTVAFQRGHGQGKEYRDAYLDTVTEAQQNEVLGSTFRISYDCGRTFGPLYQSPVTSPHGPVELPDGRIVYVGRLFDREGGREGVEAYEIHPEDGSVTFLGAIDSVCKEHERALFCEPHTIVLPDGKLICHLRVQRYVKGISDVFTVYQSVSSDGGYTWSEPKQIVGTLFGSPPHMLLHSSGLLIGTVGRREFPFGIYTYFSRDNGLTWEEGPSVYDDDVSADLGYPATVELSDGSLQTVFYAHPKKGEPAVILAQNWKLED